LPAISKPIAPPYRQTALSILLDTIDRPVYTVKMGGVKTRGRPPKGSAHEESVAQRILDSACQLFYKEGLRPTGIDRVLSQAGAAKASLYAHFGSKDDLVAAYLERQAREWRALVEERVAPADGRVGLLRLFAMLGDLVRKGDFRGCPFLNAASELPDPSHPARAVVRRQREWLHGLIRGLLSAAGVRDLDRVSRVVVALYDGALVSPVLDADAGGAAAAAFAVEQLLEVTAPSQRRARRVGHAYARGQGRT
jgi:AcrR family transcriptional regulator